MNSDVISFHEQVSQNYNERAKLRFADKAQVLNSAKNFGYSFSEKDYDLALFAFEAKLAEYTKEQFTDPNYSLWNLMWGQTYFDYLLDTLVPLISLLPTESDS